MICRPPSPTAVSSGAHTVCFSTIVSSYFPTAWTESIPSSPPISSSSRIWSAESVPKLPNVPMRPRYRWFQRRPDSLWLIRSVTKVASSEGPDLVPLALLLLLPEQYWLLAADGPSFSCLEAHYAGMGMWECLRSHPPFVMGHPIYLYEKKSADETTTFVMMLRDCRWDGVHMNIARASSQHKGSPCLP
jgi:hypothetical protein